jgi:oxalate decarboxylase/phosphoglucose isomerase-like protein (cupin superfamily)
MNIRKVTPAHHDARGTISDVLEDETIEHVSIITSASGAVRGNHYHKLTSQWLYILEGRLKVATREPNGEVRTATVEMGDVVSTGPMEEHATVALEPTTMLVLTRGPRGGRDYETDTYRLETPILTEDAS